MIFKKEKKIFKHFFENETAFIQINKNVTNEKVKESSQKVGRVSSLQEPCWCHLSYITNGTVVLCLRALPLNNQIPTIVTSCLALGL